MGVCPRGHPSDTDDFCDECGLPMNGTSAAPGSGPSVPSIPSIPRPAAGGDGETCPWCGTPRDGRFCEEDGYDFVLAPADPPSVPPSVPPSTTAFPSPRRPPLDEPAPPWSSRPDLPEPFEPSGSAPSLPAPRPEPSAVAVATTGWVVRVDADRRYFESVLERRGPDIASVDFPGYYPRFEVALVGEEMRIGRRRSTATSRGPEIDLTGPPLDPGISRLHAVLLAGPSGWSVLDPGSTNGTTINDADEPIATQTAVLLADGDRIHVGAWTTLVIVRADV